MRASFEMDILSRNDSTEQNADDNPEFSTEVIKLKSLEMKTSELSNLLKQRLQFYREENARMEEIFKSLNLLNEDLKLINTTTTDILEKLSDTQQILGTTNVNVKALSLSHAARLRKHNHYLSKLKICIKMYVHLNEKLSKEIKFTKWELEHSKAKVKDLSSVSPDEIKAMEVKVKRYENELVKFEKRYPWLKDSEFNLPNISKEMEALITLREQREKLVKELSIYQGLKPNIKEATQQLAKIKLENQEISDKLLEVRK